MDNQQRPIVQHMELCSMLCASLDGRGVWGEWLHVYVRLSLFAVHLKLSQHYLLIGYALIENKKSFKKEVGVA